MNRHLSETRGPASGIAAFRILLSVLGVARTCRFVYVVAFFYALFDRKARESARPYLQRRFPGISGFRFFVGTWRLFASQGQALVVAEAASRGMIRSIERAGEDFREAEKANRGVLLLGAHFGPWQASMRFMGCGSKPRAFLAERDRNSQIDKFHALENESAQLFSLESGTDGLLSAYEELCAGGVVALLGDRGAASGASSASASFLGAPARFPLYPFLLAARAGTPVFPFVACFGKDRREIFIEIGPSLHPRGGRRNGELAECVKAYASFLEDMARVRPYECFIFENIWE